MTNLDIEQFDSLSELFALIDKDNKEEVCIDLKGKAFREQVVIDKPNVTLTNGTIINYQNITLNANGTITGAVSGTWQQAAESCAATLKINNTTYQGYFAAEYDESTGKRVMVFTAVGNNNQTIWGAQTKAWSGNERSVQPITYADGK